MKDCRTIFALVVATLLYAVPAHAQLSGSNIAGDFGLKSGSQAPPGVYLGYFLYNYGSSRLVGQDGRELSFDKGDIDAFAHVAIVSVVTGKKFLGGHYGATFIPSVVNLSIEAPRVSLEEGTGFGVADLYVIPVNLGWTTKHADITTWYGFFAPTGEYTAAGSPDRGLGMWSHEIALGSTFYLNKSKSVHASALGAYEMHSKKKDTDVRVGQLLTIEGGVGVTTEKAMNFGMAYYAQWKVTDDSGLGLPALVEDRLGKNRNYGLGPEAGMVLPLSKDLSKLALLNVRHLFDLGSRLDTKGQTLALNVTFKVK